MRPTPISLIQGTASLAEGPWWHSQEQALYFIDIPAGRIWRFDPVTAVASLFHEGAVTGGMTLQDDGSWLLFREKDVAQVDSRGKLRACRSFHLPGAHRFNDVIADPHGRVFAGTIGVDDQSGGLYRFELDGTCSQLLQGTGCANGMAFSPNQDFFYWTCSTTRTISRFAYAAETGDLSDRRLLYRSAPGTGLPDGLTVDREGNLWSPHWGGRCLVILSPGGEKLGQIDFPETNITSVAWGGRDLTDLYVTAARQDGEPGLHDLFVVPQAGQGMAQANSRLRL
jgi:sugar lactone lactonase YvrE